MQTLTALLRHPRMHVLLRYAPALSALGGMGVVGLASWMFIHQPDTAAQLIAILVILATILAIVLAPHAGFLVWIFLFPFAPYLGFDFHMPAGVPDLSYGRMVGGFLAIYLLAQVALGRRRLASPTFIELALPFFAVTLLIAGARSIDGWLWGVQAVFDAYLVPLLVYFIARHLLQTDWHMVELANVLLAIGVVIASLTISEQLTGFTLFRPASTSDFYSAGIRKVGALLGNPAYIAYTLAIILPLAIERILSRHELGPRLAYAGVALLLIAAIFLTYNRSGWLGGAAVLAIIAITEPRLRKWVVGSMVAGGLIIFLLGNSFSETAAGKRFTAESPIDYRLEALRVGLIIHREQPLLGIGWSSFGRIAQQRGFALGGHAFVLPSTHNTYLNMLVSGGYLLLGGWLLLAVAIGLSLWSVWRGFRRRGQPAPLLLRITCASYFGYFVPAIGFDNNYAVYGSIVFWVLLGGAITVLQRQLAVANWNDPSPVRQVAG